MECIECEDGGVVTVKARTAKMARDKMDGAHAFISDERYGSVEIYAKPDAEGKFYFRDGTTIDEYSRLQITRPRQKYATVRSIGSEVYQKDLVLSKVSHFMVRMSA